VAKNCTYCGQPLAKEDASFCNECGRLQIPEPDSMAPGVIKVRLPPKEVARRELPPPPSPEGMSFERTPGLSPAPQDQRGQPAPASQPSHLARRPARQTNQESQIAEDRSEIARETESPSTFASRSARQPADQPAPVEEISTMVLPGWREELERLRKRQAATSAPAAPETHLSSPLLISPAASRPSGRATPLPPSREPEVQKASAEDAIVDVVQNTQAPEKSPSDSLRPELRFRIWEQRPTMHYPQVQVQKEAEPASAGEHPPFVHISGAEEETASVADKGGIDWQALSGPVMMSDPEPVEAGTRQIDTVRQEEAEESGVEDLPTVPLAVPDAAKQQSPITIERSSPPAPGNRPAAREAVEDLPTRPVPATQAGPRSPFPPAVPQSLQSREREQREARPAPVPMVPNPPSSPGAYRQEAAPLMSAPQAPSVPLSPPVRGRVPGPNSQPGQVFNPAGMPQGLHSSPDSTAVRPQPPTVQQRLPVFAPATPPPVSSRSAEAAPARPRDKRVKPLRVALLVVLIIAAGMGAFVFYYQSSSGGAVAQPYQAFQNSTLGVSLNYPQSWTSSVDQRQTSVRFADSSQTGQVTLSMAAANAQSLTQYIDQEATQLGITAPQLEPTIVFGGTGWQQERGNVVQRGVTYTLDLYATQHGTHIYSLIFMAPPPVYGEMEQENFAPLRTSFRFIGQ